MSCTVDNVFVLWGSCFDEAAAVVAIVSLRRKGCRVTVVGLDGACPKGAHGLGLVADMTLSEALASTEPISSVLIPSGDMGARWAEQDPRIKQFLETAKSMRASVRMLRSQQNAFSDSWMKYSDFHI